MLTSAYETPALIATAISQGDKKAEAVLFEKYYKPTLYLMERRTRDPDLAQDLCQEAFCIVLERLRINPLSEPDKLAAYLHSVASNLYIAGLRKAGRQKTLTDPTLAEKVADATQNQFRILLRERTSTAVRSLIESMENTRDRRLLYGFYVQEREKAELCDELDLSLRHFDRVLFRAKQRFRDLILQGTDHTAKR